MGNDEEYERGVHDGQNAGAMDQFCNGLGRGFGNPAYDKGFDYGVDHKPSDSGSSSSSWWGNSSENKDSGNSRDESQASNSEPETSSSSSSGGGYYSSGDSGGYSGGGGRSANTESGGLVGILGGLLILGAVCWGASHLFTGSKIEPRQEVRIEQQENFDGNVSAAVKVARLLRYLDKHNPLKENLNDYQMIVPPGFVKHKELEIAFSKEHAFYVFHSSDNGRTWALQQPTDPYIIKVKNVRGL
jgi:hypothetical protein